MEWLPKIMEDTGSNESQHGKFGIESWHSRGVFRGVKVKHLSNTGEPSDPSRSVTLKGIPRGLHSRLAQYHFLDTKTYEKWEECEELCHALWHQRNDAKKFQEVLETAEPKARVALVKMTPPSYTAQYLKIRGRVSCEISLATERKTIGSAINMKRKMTVLN